MIHILSFILRIIQDLIITASVVVLVTLWIPFFILCLTLKLIIHYKRYMQFLFVSTSLGANARIIL